jgi:hypothetical protein
VLRTIAITTGRAGRHDPVAVVLLIALVLLAVVTALGGVSVAQTKSIDASRSADPMAPVRLLQRVPGIQMDDTTGRPSLDSAWLAVGHWGYPFWSPGPDLSYGERVQVWYYRDHAKLREALQNNLGRSAHTAVLTGDVWFIELDAGSSGRLGVDGPTPKSVASALSGQVAKVWP